MCVAQHRNLYFCVGNLIVDKGIFNPDYYSGDRLTACSRRLPSLESIMEVLELVLGQ